MEFVTQLPVNEPLDWILNVTMIKINKNLNKLKPSFITGFTDAESSFVIKISRDHRAKTGWRIDPAFEIGLNEKDLVLLEKIQSFFAKGSIRKNKVNNAVIFAVQSIKDLATVIIPHFEKYPLISQKRVDFELFKQVVVIMINKQHLSLSGLQEVVNIRASMNKGMTEILKESFPNTIPVHRRAINSNIVSDPNWLTGFVEGEGSFIISLVTNASAKLGIKVSLRFSISQHDRDIKLMDSLVKFLGCGSIVKHNAKFSVEFVVTKFSDIQEKIIPFFEKNSLQGIKSLKFNSFTEAAELIKK